MNYIFLLLIVILVLIYGIISLHIHQETVSFEESYNKVGLPVIDLYNDNYKINFLVDTGSDANFIDENILKYVHYTDASESRGVLCASGTTEAKAVYITLNDRENLIVEKFFVINMSSMNNEHNMDINGILGSKFCSDAKFVIDYSNKTISTK